MNFRSSPVPAKTSTMDWNNPLFKERFKLETLRASFSESNTPLSRLSCSNLSQTGVNQGERHAYATFDDDMFTSSTANKRKSFPMATSDQLPLRGTRHSFENMTVDEICAEIQRIKATVSFIKIISINMKGAVRFDKMYVFFRKTKEKANFESQLLYKVLYF